MIRNHEFIKRLDSKFVKKAFTFCTKEHLLVTLESGINIRVRLLIFEVFSRGYVLIKGGYVY